MIDPAFDLVQRAGIATGIPHSRIYSSTRVRRVVLTRWAIWHTLRTRHGWTFSEIGAHFCCHHTNAVHGVAKAAELIAKDHWFSALIQALK